MQASWDFSGVEKRLSLSNQAGYHRTTKEQGVYKWIFTRNSFTAYHVKL